MRGGCDHQVPLSLHREYEVALRPGIVCRKSQNRHNSFCPSLDFPTGYSWDSSLSSPFSKGDAGKPPTAENRGYRSPQSKFQFSSSFFAQGGRDVDRKLLLGEAVASFTISSFCCTWEKLVLPPAHVPSGRDERTVVLLSTEQRFCSCFKHDSYPFSFGHGIQT